MNVLDWPLILRTRRNHGLEHATIHVLASRLRGVSIAGRSTPNGFYIIGNVAAEDVASAADEALRRIRNGEPQLTIHPSCGTNYMTSGTFAGLAAVASIGFGRRSRWEQLPGAIIAATLALFVAAPVGPLLQARVTTSGDMGDLEIISVRKLPGRVTAHYVETSSS